MGRGQHQLVARLGHDHVDQRVALAELDGDDAAPQRAAVGFQRRLLHQSAGRGHDQEMVGPVEIADRPAVGDLLALAEVQQVHHGAAAGVAGQLRQVVHLAPIHLALVGEKQQVGVGAGDEQVLDRVFLFGFRPHQALAAAALGPIDRGGRPLDVAVAADRDDHRLFGDQVLHVELAHLLAADFGAAGVAVLPLQLAAVVANDVQNVLPVGEDAAVLGDFLQQLAMLAGELFLLQIDQLAEGHAQDGVGLDGRERVELGQRRDLP